MNADDGKRIRVLVVEDSPSMRELIVHLLERDPRLEVVGTAGDGVEAVEQALRLAPDVITMDIHMPKMDGFEATRLIMERAPVPIVVVSASAPRNEAVASFRVIEAGAVAMVPKPHVHAEDEVKALIETVRLMAGVKVIRRWPRKGAVEPARLNGFDKPPDAVKVVAIGASTGGPPVLCTILGKLPHDFPAPVVITQHITPGFTDGFVQWLSQASKFPVVVAKDGQLLSPARAYVAPDGAHLTLAPSGRGGCSARLDNDEPENGHRPSVSHLFRSAAEYFGASAVGVLLSGMGQDGAKELKMMRDRGSLTIVQSPETAVVAGMPGTAIDLGAPAQILPPEQIAWVLQRAVGKAEQAGADAQQSR